MIAKEDEFGGGSWTLVDSYVLRSVCWTIDCLTKPNAMDRSDRPDFEAGPRISINE